MRAFCFVIVFHLVVGVTYSQFQPGIYVNNHTLYPVLLDNDSRNTIDWPDNNCKNGRCFAIIQFSEVPTEAEFSELEELDIELFGYIPDLAFLASAPSGFDETLPDFVMALEAVLPTYKRPIVPLAAEVNTENESEYHLYGIPFPGLTPIQLAAELEELDATITLVDEVKVAFQLPSGNLFDLLSSPLLQYTENVPPAPESEGHLGRINGSVSYLNTGFGMGLDGQGVKIAIADDGQINHIDFSERVTDFTQYHTGDHADMTSGMAIGGGIIDPLTQGMAPGALLHLYDISSYSHILNAPSNYLQDGVVITSTSFGEGCGDAYGTTAQSIDAQVANMPYILHFFSAGNHGANPCFNGYGLLGSTPQGNFFSNITGGRKAAKNVMAIGNNSYDDVVKLSSSRGPTPDGRIKPDITAMGQGDWTTDADNSFRLSSGTSAASPSVAGIAAGLYQYYRNQNGGNDPSSALIKAALLNGAEDFGLPGPDYSYGWGRVNARRSLQILENNTYFNNYIGHGATNNHQLVIPAGTKRLKVMVYWHDPAGSLLASKALVNDLDMKLVTSSGQTLLPWTPSFAQNLDSLTMPAQHRVDRVNNMEQIVIDNPSSGYYDLQIKGHQVPQGPQNYYVVYHIESNPITVVFPYENATLVPYEENVIKWDAVGNTGTFTAQYSTNGLNNWQTIATNIPGDARNLLWNTPSTPSNQLYVRIIRNNETGISSGAAVICATPVFAVNFASNNSVEVSWNPVPGASSYEILRLGAGDSHLEVVGSTNNLNFFAPVNLNETYWFTVRAVFANGKKGRRAIAQEYIHFGCDAQYNLAIQFDLYPQEISWMILDAFGNTVIQSPSYLGQTPSSLINIPICLPNDCYTFIISDSYSDGLCCNNGNGWYQLTGQNGQVLINGSSFGAMEYNIFCPAPQNNPLTVNIAGVHHVSCYGNQNGAAQVFANGGSGNYNYLWSTGATTQGVNYLPAGTHSVTVSDGTQSQTLNVVINQPAPITLTPATQIAVCNDGTIQLNASGGTAPYNISWSDGGIGWNRTNLPPGNYYALVTDAQGCLGTQNITIGQGEPISVSLSTNQPSCQSPVSGSVFAQAAGGHGNYSYYWHTGQTGQYISGLGGGSYQLTISDQGGCQINTVAYLNAPSELEVDAQIEQVSCFGSQDGYIAIETIGGTAPFTYNWSDGETSAIRNNISPGWYSVTINDASGCSLIRNYQLFAPQPLIIQSNASPATNFSGGTIDISVNGGFAPYSIQWSNGATGTHLENLTEGTYTATISDSNGCLTSTSLEVEFEEISTDNLIYCDQQGGSTTYEWIASIAINNIIYGNGNDGGYGDYTSTSIPIMAGEELALTLTPGYLYASYGENWRIWIDFNRDGDFNDSGEEVVTINAFTGAVSTNASIPTNIVPGETRMRVAMQYGSLPSLCQNLNYGEVEDYTVEILLNENLSGGGLRPGNNISSTNNINKWILKPNPVTQEAFLNGWLTQDETLSFKIIDQRGSTIRQWQNSPMKGSYEERLELSQLTPGIYMIQLTNGDWTEMVRFVKM